MDSTGPGILAAVVMVCLGLVELLRHFVSKRNGNGNKLVTPVPICPNKVDLSMFGETIRKIDSNVRTAAADAVSVKAGVDTLVQQHAATEDGILNWKILPSHVAAWERIARRQEDVLVAMNKMVDMERDIFEVLQSHSENTMKVYGELMKRDGGKS